MNNGNKTVKELIAELQKFPDNAVCFAYEGEQVGIIIETEGKQDFIECVEWSENE